MMTDPQLLYEAISRGKKEWEQTFDAVPDLIFITDTRHTITRANRATAQRCGLQPTEIPGRKCYELIHGLDSPPSTCPFLRGMQKGETQTREVEEELLGGCFDVSVSPLYDQQGELTACVHVARDVTERKRAEAQRLLLEQQLQQAQKLESLGILSGGIAHDFNNILTIILGHCALAKEAAPTGPARSHLGQIEVAGNRAAELCRQMLTYAGKSPLEQNRLDLRLLVEETVTLLHPAFKKNVSFAFEMTDDLPDISGDRGKVHQIVMNLIVNAIEAIGERKGRVSLALAPCAIPTAGTDPDCFGNPIPPGRYARLTVSDTGCGMDAETRKRIFDPFFTTKFTGRGLGMSAIMGVIKSHQGALQVDSTPGIGTTFLVYLPLPPGKERRRRSDAVQARPAEAPLCGMVLLVDDEPELRGVGSVLLEGMGCSVITASNGREALEIYDQRSGEIDLVLLDLTMPEMDGMELYQELRKRARSLPVLFCSGYGNKEVSPFLARDTHAAFLAKPYRPDLMREMLGKLWHTRTGGRKRLH